MMRAAGLVNKGMQESMPTSYLRWMNKVRAMQRGMHVASLAGPGGIERTFHSPPEHRSFASLPPQRVAKYIDKRNGVNQNDAEDEEDNEDDDDDEGLVGHSGAK